MALPSESWNLDVSALMILVGEKEETKYRMVRRSLLECFNPAPVVGLQGYLQHPDKFPRESGLSYFSPYGQKSAPLRNTQFANVIEQRGLLRDTKYTVLRVPSITAKSYFQRCHVLLAIWSWTCWITVLILLALLFYLPAATWIGRVNCIAYICWSMLVRLSETALASKAPDVSHVSAPMALDAVFILGRANSCLVLEGSRKDIKLWTAQAMQYYESHEAQPLYVRMLLDLWVLFTRGLSLVILLLVFTTIPNGATTDQVIFTALNALGQVNVTVGRKLNSSCTYSKLELVESAHVKTRTEIYAKLLRHFSAADGPKDWLEKANMLPQTDIWTRWAKRIVEESQADPKALYDKIARDP